MPARPDPPAGGGPPGGEKKDPGVLTALEAGGLEISAIHNHLVGESPHVIYLHFSGHGNAAAIARTLKEALGKTQTPMTPVAPVQASAADQQAFKTVQEVLGRSGALAGTVLQIGVPRAEKIIGVHERRNVWPRGHERS